MAKTNHQPFRQVTPGRILQALALGLVCLLTLLGSTAQATVKANNQDNLNLTTSWVSGVVPPAGDTVNWDSTVTGANTTVLGASMTWNKIGISNPGGAVTINADGNTLTINTSGTGISLGSSSPDFTINCLYGMTTWHTNNIAAGKTLTINGNISGAGKPLTKWGDGTIILNGANTHGATIIGTDANQKGGVAIIGSNGALGSGGATLGGSGCSALWIRNNITVNNAISLNTAAGNGITEYGCLRNIWGNNTWAGIANGNGSPRISSDSGTLKFTGGVSVGSATARTPIFIGAGDIWVASVVSNAGTGAGGLTHQLGTGTLRLSGANTYKGPTTLISGTTILDYGSVANVLPDVTVLTLEGGTLTLTGGSAPDVVASTTLASGFGATSITRSSGTSSLRLNAITRASSTTVDFGMGGVADTDNTTLNGILGGWATVGGADWATTNGVSLTGDAPIVGCTAYQTATAPGTWAAADNVSLAGSPSGNVPTTTINSLKLSGASTVTIDTGATLTNVSGGVLVTGSGATTIAGADATAKIVGAASTDLIVHQYSSADCTISAVIGDNTGVTRLTKSGPGRLVLSGVNTYSGNTFIDAGTLSISSDLNIGTGANLYFNGGRLQVTGNTTTTKLLQSSPNTTCVIDVAGGATFTQNGVFGSSSQGWFTKTGSGTWLIAAASTTYQGELFLNGGIVNAGVAETAGTSGPFGNQATGTAVSGASVLLHFGGGTLQYSAANNFDYSYRFSMDPNQAYSVDLAGRPVTWATGLTSSGGTLAVQDTVGGGVLTLTGASTYSGKTTIGSGTVALSGSGSFKNSSQLSLAAGSTLDASLLASPFNLSSSTALSASGTGTGVTAAAIKGAALGTVNLGTQPITLAYDGSNPALYVSQGILQVQGNAWTVNGAALTAATTYNIAADAGGAPVVSGTHTVYGTAISGMTGTIASDGAANVQLTTSAALTPTTTSVASTANPSIYGTAPTITATVSSGTASGTVLFVVDGVPQLTAVTVSGGTASFTPANSLAAGSHTVVAQYSGDATYGSSVSATFNQIVSPKALTMTGLSTPATRVYDGTALAYVSGVPSLAATEAFGSGTSSDGQPYTGDLVGIIGQATGTYNSADVASATTVTFAGLTLNGAQSANYTLTMQSPAAATITAKALTVAGAAVTPKLYDGTTAATVTGSLVAESAGSGASNDGKAFIGDNVVLALGGTFGNKNVGTGKSVTSSCSISGAQAGDYSLTQPTLTGNILQTNITVTAAVDSKTYDGTTSSTASPTVTLGSVQPGDTAPTWTESYDTKHVGVSKTLTPAGTITDGNGGANYSYTFVTAVGAISQENITVTAAANTKTYNGTTAAAAAPAITSGSVQTGDTANFAEIYDTKHVGTGKTLTPSGIVTDGNGGANYSYTFVPAPIGTISQESITLTAVTNTKLYDGTISAAAAPSVTSGSVQTGDTASFSETYDTKNVGAGKALTPAGTVTDGNGGANYSYTFVPAAAGTISQTNITVTAATNTKTYDGNTTAAAAPTVTAGNIQTGDTVNFTETYDNANVGTGKTLTPAGTVTDGNGGANYNVTFANDTTGVISLPCGAAIALMNIVNNLDGTSTLSFVGTPLAEYYVVSSSDVTAPMSTWAPVIGSTNAASSPSGSWSLIVPNAGTQTFYRGTAVTPCP